ncbi:hypothetical protein CRYUN_Cryun28dG0062100 [Craigia yunnanensis]
MEDNGSRAEAIRLLGIAEKLLQNRDFNGSRDFAILAQETEPLLDGSDQILAIVDVLLAAEKRINNHHDWYSILQVDRRSEDNDLIKKQYRRLALLLHPDKNKFPFSDHAFKLVADAWAVLSNSSKKSLYDKELSLFTRIDFSSAGDRSNQVGKLPVTRRGENQERVQHRTPNSKAQNENQRLRLSTFWTSCPYCYRLFEYPRVYEGCCLRCQSCERSFHAVLIPTLPPLVPGKEAYYCCWAIFPLGFVSGKQEGGGKPPTGFPNWMPPMFPGGQQESERNGGSVPAPPPPAAAPTTATKKVAVESRNNVAGVSGGNMSAFAPRKRGRPRKNPL